MNLGDKDKVAEATIKKEQEKHDQENKVIAEVNEQITIKKGSKVVVKEDIIA
jgi:hypothetical protein